MRGFKDLKTLQKYTEKYNRYQDGDTMYIQDEDKVYIYKNKEWKELKATIVDSNIQMSIYDLNKQIMAQMEPFTIEQWEQSEKDLTNWEKNNNNNYYMMLCKEKSYYTLFVGDGYEFHNFGAAIRECLEFVGNVVSIDINPEVVEIWIKEQNDSYCIHLFGYDEGVVSFKK